MHRADLLPSHATLIKQILRLCLSVFACSVLTTPAHATVTIRQIVTAVGPNQTCNVSDSSGSVCTPATFFVPLTISFSPTLGGSALVLVGDREGTCTDNFGQAWGTGPPAGGQTAGITSITCSSVGQLTFYELTGVQSTTPVPVSFPNNSTDTSCSGTIDAGFFGIINVPGDAWFEGSPDPGAPQMTYSSTFTLGTTLSQLEEQIQAAGTLWWEVGLCPNGPSSPSCYVYQNDVTAIFYADGGPQGVSGTVNASYLNQGGPRGSAPDWGGGFSCYVSEWPEADYSVDLGSSCPRSGNDGTCGQPINLRTGNTYITEQDYSLPGLGGGLGLTRTWNSMWPLSSPGSEIGMFGDSWVSNYEERMLVSINSGGKYWRGDGSAWTLTYNSTTQLYTVTSPPDEHASLAFNSTTNLSTLTFPDGSKKIFTQSGLLQNIVDRNGNQTTLTDDSSGRLIKATDAAGRILNFNYANSSFPNQVSSIQDAVGVIASYTYNTGGFLASVTYADSSVASFAYDSNGLILSVTDAQGKVLEAHTYDANRRGLTSQRANGVDLVTANYTGTSANISDTNGNMTNYGITNVGKRNLVSSITGPGCDTCVGRGNWSYTYDTQANRTQAVDPLGHFTNYTYDANGNMLEQLIQRDSANDTQNWNYTYNSFNEVLTATDPLGNVTTNTYDTKGNMLTTTTPSPGGHTSGSKTTFTYDTKGELTKITDPLSHSTTLAYNSVGLISSITDAQSKVTQFQYDSRGNRTAVIDALNQQTTFTYDSMNRLTKITYPTSPATSTQFAYDYRGRKISVTDPNLKITQYGYDDADRLISVTDPNSGETQYGYDNESNLTSITDASGNKTTLVYDPYGHVTQTSFPSSFAETYSYDLDGNLLTKTDRNGHLIDYGYDFLNRLTSKSYPDSTAVNYTYDLANRLTQVSDPTGTYGDTYDNMGRLTQTSTAYAFISGKNFTVGYAYDAASNRTSMTDPQNAASAYVYDTLNRMTTLTYPSRTNYSFTYDALGRRTQLSRPNSVATNYQYDVLSRLTSVLHQKSSTTLDGATYVYDAAGNRTSKTDKRTSITSTFSYDPLYELTQVLQGSSTTENYSYDAIGNRLSSLGVSPYAYNTSNQLTSYPGVAYTYDNNGNTLTKVTSAGTTSYSWDFENRLTSVMLPGSGGTVNFKYDPFGRRIQKVSSAGTTNYVYDGANVLEEVDGSGNVLARYVQNSGVDEPLAETRASTTSYYEADALGTVTSLSNSSGSLANTYSYDSYGTLTSSTGTITNPYRYTGRDFDSETGLDYYRARYYDPQIGRFISEDPARSSGNFYAYTRNNPTNRTDPLGLWDTYTHHALIWNALRGCGVSNNDIWQIQEESDFVDLVAQLPGDAYKHAMKAPGQSAADAVQESTTWVQDNLNSAASMYQQYGDTASLSNPTSTWTTPFGDALHTITDSTSPMHRNNGTPLSWPMLPNAFHHGGPGNMFGSGETWSDMTPALMQQNIDMIRQAYQQVTGHKCGCEQ